MNYASWIIPKSMVWPVSDILMKLQMKELYTGRKEAFQKLK
jgi:hypothetical protein